MTYRNCPDCTAYAERRMPVLAPAMAETLAKTGETSQQILDRYMTGVHERHLAGGSL
jgi:hypothetical protein